jgi:Ulp1 family protease
MNNEPSSMNKQREEQLIAANFPLEVKVTSIQNQISKSLVTNLPSTPSRKRVVNKTSTSPKTKKSKVDEVSFEFHDEVKAASSTLLATSQLKTPRKQAPKKTSTSPRTKKVKVDVVKTPKKRAANKIITSPRTKKKKVDEVSFDVVESMAVKDTSEFLFQFSVALTPLQKLLAILKDPRISPDNPQKSEIAHYVSEDKKLYGISYEEFLRHRENDYMGCEVINGFMHLLEEKYNNMGKNKFFSHQFFSTVLDEKMSRSNADVPSRLTKMANTNKDNWNNTWERLFFPINVWDNHWILIVLDKTTKQVMVFDSVKKSNKYQAEKILNLVNEMEGSTAEWSIVTNEQNSGIQRQHDAVNCGYFTCWYARQLVTNQSIQCFSGDHDAAVQDIREDIMCSIIEREIVIGDDKRKKK